MAEYPPSSGWYRLKLTIQAGQVDADETDYPVYVDLSDLTADFWDNVENGGGSIRITESDQTTEVPREIVTCNTSTDTGEIHFLGDISSSSGTVFYISYGKGGEVDYATDATYGAEAVWANYGLVSHDGGGNDSTANGNDGTGSGGVSIGGATGKIGSATDFDGSNDYITISDAASLDLGSTFTASCWVRFDGGTPDSYERILVKKLDYNSSNGWEFSPEQNNTALTIRGSGADTAGGIANYTPSWSAANWTCMQIVYNGGTATAYRDGSSQGSIGVTSVTNNTTSLYVARYGSSVINLWEGPIDEVRLTGDVQTADWVSTEYNNQNSPSTFYVDSDYEAPGAGVTIPIFMHHYTKNIGSR